MKMDMRPFALSIFLKKLLQEKAKYRCWYQMCTLANCHIKTFYVKNKLLGIFSIAVLLLNLLTNFS